jgi:hypothetical protein
MVAADIAGLEEALASTHKKQKTKTKAAAAEPPSPSPSAPTKRTTVTRLFRLLSIEADFRSSHGTAGAARVPDWSKVPAERAIRHDYDARTTAWTRQSIVVKIAPHPFASGGMRSAHFAVIVGEERSVLVAKFVHAGGCCCGDDEAEMRALTFQNVEQQMIARHYAAQYNKLGPPKRVDFLEASAIELVDRARARMPLALRIAGLEPYLAGDYVKWNSNFGWVAGADNARNTPQAFSHFTYEKSKRQIIIVDIQGVGDRFTDPVIHTRDRAGDELFAGNLGIEGIEQFLLTHRCNPLCRALHLPPLDSPVLTAIATADASSSSPSSPLSISAQGTQFPAAADHSALVVTQTSVNVAALGRVPDEETSLLSVNVDGNSSGSCCNCCTIS